MHSISGWLMWECTNFWVIYCFNNRLYLVGQSAGAHLGACALTDQVKKQIDRGDIESVTEPYHSGNEDSLLWTPSQFKAYIGISGGWICLVSFNNLLSHEFNVYLCIIFSLLVTHSVLWQVWSVQTFTTYSEQRPVSGIIFQVLLFVPCKMKCKFILTCHCTLLFCV